MTVSANDYGLCDAQVADGSLGGLARVHHLLLNVGLPATHSEVNCWRFLAPRRASLPRQPYPRPVLGVKHYSQGLAISIQALPGGVIVNGTTTEQVIDMSLFCGRDVKISCATQDVLFCATNQSGGGTLLTTATAASRTALIADRAPAGFGVVRHIIQGAHFLVVKLAAGTDTIVIKSCSITTSREGR